MKEQEPVSQEGVRVLGNLNISTDIGLISVEVDPNGLRQELISSVNAFYDNEDLRRRGVELSRKVALVLSPESLKGLFSSENSSWARLEDKMSEDFASFSKNVLDPTEMVFFFNLPKIIKDLKLTDADQFRRKFFHLWNHEKHHFVQEADPINYSRVFIERELGFAGFLLLVTVSGVAGKIGSHALSTRREFLGAIIGMGLGGAVGAISFNPLFYNLPFTYEGEAEEIARRSAYSLKALERTFKIKLTPNQ